MKFWRNMLVAGADINGSTSLYLQLLQWSCHMSPTLLFFISMCLIPMNAQHHLVNFFKYPSQLLFKFNCCLSLPFHAGIPLPSRGKVGKNRSALSKTTVRSKRVFPLKVRWGPHYCFPTVLTIFVLSRMVVFDI